LLDSMRRGPGAEIDSNTKQSPFVTSRVWLTHYTRAMVTAYN